VRFDPLLAVARNGARAGARRGVELFSASSIRSPLISREHARACAITRIGSGVVVLAWERRPRPLRVASRVGDRLVGIIVAQLLAWALIFNLTALPIHVVQGRMFGCSRSPDCWDRDRRSTSGASAAVVTTIGARFRLWSLGLLLWRHELHAVGARAILVGVGSLVQ
jgi:hypothetical protein